ncbi:hypothetical protein PC116_g19303 [Phytophthora cactorum]|nr:hypothetical protein Pcac1_g25519 [Phytophthora cactorum]KAG4232449.1 hypothetical protein PC116_g19303 [Phytophthora cactorum]
MRVSVKGKRRKPPKYKNTAETFEFKAAVLTYYDTHTMAAAIGAFGQVLLCAAKPMRPRSGWSCGGSSIAPATTHSRPAPRQPS